MDGYRCWVFFLGGGFRSASNKRLSKYLKLVHDNVFLCAVQFTDRSSKFIRRSLQFILFAFLSDYGVVWWARASRNLIASLFKVKWLSIRRLLVIALKNHINPRRRGSFFCTRFNISKAAQTRLAGLQIGYSATWCTGLTTASYIFKES